jgi:hypothetical protein
MTKESEAEIARLRVTAGPPDSSEAEITTEIMPQLINCDSLTGWSVESGAGVTVELDTSENVEGTGSIKITVPEAITGVVKYTKPTGSWDLSGQGMLKISIRVDGLHIEGATTDDVALCFGETAYNEQTKELLDVPYAGWTDYFWNIKPIADASKNAVTIFAVRIQNTGTGAMTVRVDDVRLLSSTRVEIMRPEGLTRLFPIELSRDPTVAFEFLEDFLAFWDDTGNGILHADKLWTYVAPPIALAAVGGKIELTGTSGASNAMHPLGQDALKPFQVLGLTIRVMVRQAQYGSGASTRRIGLADGDLDADPVNGIFFRYDDGGDYYGVCRAASAESSVSTSGYAAANGVQDDLMIEITKDVVTEIPYYATPRINFYVNSYLIGSITDNIPSVGLYFSLGTSNIHVTRGLDLDYVHIVQER